MRRHSCARRVYDLCKHYHTLLGVVTAWPLMLMAATGMLYRVLRAVFHVEKQYVSWLLGLHDLSIIGLGAYYPILLALLTVLLVITSIPLFVPHAVLILTRVAKGRRVFRGTWNAAAAHRVAGYSALIPLLMYAVSGALYSLERYWGSADQAFMKQMMMWHQLAFAVPPVVWVVIGCGITIAVVQTGAILYHEIYDPKLSHDKQE